MCSEDAKWQKVICATFISRRQNMYKISAID